MVPDGPVSVAPPQPRWRQGRPGWGLPAPHPSGGRCPAPPSSSVSVAQGTPLTLGCRSGHLSCRPSTSRVHRDPCHTQLLASATSAPVLSPSRPPPRTFSSVLGSPTHPSLKTNHSSSLGLTRPCPSTEGAADHRLRGLTALRAEPLLLPSLPPLTRPLGLSLGRGSHGHLHHLDPTWALLPPPPGPAVGEHAPASGRSAHRTPPPPPL